jgi:hypothetical protein
VADGGHVALHGGRVVPDSLQVQGKRTLIEWVRQEEGGPDYQGACRWQPLDENMVVWPASISHKHSGWMKAGKQAADALCNTRTHRC